MVINVNNVSKTYCINSGWGQKEKVIAVDNITFSVETGERVGFIGPNGAGKSTTVKMLAGIIEPTAGDISVLNMDPIKGRKKLAYQTSVLFGQKSQLSAHLSAKNNFSLLASIYDIEKNQYAKRFDYLVHEFEVFDFINTPIRQLSLGQRIRCEIIAALLHHPQIVFLDEPTIGLDTIAKQNLRALLMKMNQIEGTTLLVTSHDLGDIEKLCDRIIIIMDGRIVFNDNIARLKSLPQYDGRMLKIRFSGEIPDQFALQHEIVRRDKFEVAVKLASVLDLPFTISHLQEYVQIVDIEIAPMPLEDIISSIYSKGGISG